MDLKTERNVIGQIEQHDPTLKNRNEHMCFRRVNSFCSTSGTRRVTLVQNSEITHKR